MTHNAQPTNPESAGIDQRGPESIGTREDAARFIVWHGRSWLALTDEELQRGSQAIIRDPKYRRELLRDARNSLRPVPDHNRTLDYARRRIEEPA